MARTRKKEAPPTRAQALRAVRIFGGINLALGLYAILDAFAALGGIDLPGAAARMVGEVLGIIVVVIVWGAAVVSGLGLLLLAGWGRRLAVLWGRIIVWVLPIAFGLSPGGLGKFFSVAFAIIIVICLYANIVAQNLARPEFDVAFTRD
jgi:hypothetical protein